MNLRNQNDFYHYTTTLAGVTMIGFSMPFLLLPKLRVLKSHNANPVIAGIVDGVGDLRSPLAVGVGFAASELYRARACPWPKCVGEVTWQGQLETDISQSR